MEKEQLFYTHSFALYHTSGAKSSKWNPMAAHISSSIHLCTAEVKNKNFTCYEKSCYSQNTDFTNKQRKVTGQYTMMKVYFISQKVTIWRRIFGCADE